MSREVEQELAYCSSRMSVRKRRERFVWALILLGGLALGSVSASSGTKLTSVTRAELCVTEGAIEQLPGQRLSVHAPKMRAYLDLTTPQVVEADFTYLGSTGNEARLGSGELRRQFGLKLRAQDACNLVYAMWRIEPESKLVVSVKSNPGQHTSSECGNRGYRNVKALRSKPVPVLRSGDAHILRAEMNGDETKVFADNVMVWEGSVGPEVQSLEGPVGIRSDNARLQIRLLVAKPLQASAAGAPGCRSGADEAE
jgi:hypothetical protein